MTPGDHGDDRGKRSGFLDDLGGSAHDETLETHAPRSEHEEGLLGELGNGDHPRRRRSGLKSCLALLVVVALMVVAGIAAVTFGRDRITDLMAGPPDYTGEGTGSLLFEVEEGQSVAEIGRNLKSEDVVKSVEAFTEAAKGDDDATSIQVGFYELKREMPAADALEVLLDSRNLVQNTVTVPEGLRVEQTLKALAKGTDIPLREFKAAAENARAIGLPRYAKGNPEGYLFPATYAFGPRADAVDMLGDMVDRWRQAAEEADLEGAAEELGYTPHQLMTIASLVESEANRDQDRGKVARVIYNRLETDATDGRLQIDATVNYALGRDLGLGLSPEDLDVDSPYNTRRYPGLPPGPIESPGDKAIEAASDPPEGDWIYYVTVNLDSGETRFTDDYQQFLSWKNKDLAEFCESSDRC
jgi:UPF0755 protein